MRRHNNGTGAEVKRRRQKRVIIKKDVVCLLKGGGTHCKIGGDNWCLVSITLLQRHRKEKRSCLLAQKTLVPFVAQKNWEAIFYFGSMQIHSLRGTEIYLFSIYGRGRKFSRGHFFWLRSSFERSRENTKVKEGI